MAISSPAREFVDRLIQIRDEAGQRAFISESDFPLSQELVDELSERIRRLLLKDPPLAEALAESNLELAARLDTPLAWGYAYKCKAFAFTNLKKAAEAEPFYEKAGQAFTEAGAMQEMGRMLCAQAYNLNYLSEYERAQELATRARELLEEAGDTEYLPRVYLALASTFYRQNRFADQLAQYDEMLEKMRDSDDYNIIATGHHNRGQALVELNRFDEAMQAYEIARECCEQHGLVPLLAGLEGDMAELHFKRGNYSEALRIREKVRLRWEESSNDRQVAICDRARAEIYLQLNLAQEAADVAERAHATFERQSSMLDAAKCLEMVGIAHAEREDSRAAEETFRRARKLFYEEGNEVSTASVDLQLAKLLYKQRQFPEAQQLALSAAEAFEAQELAVRGAYARIVAADSLVGSGRRQEALKQAQKALEQLEGYHAKWVSYQCYDLLGRLKVANGSLDEAERLYSRAIDEMESLRGNIQLDEFRMSFGKNKYQVYENLVDLKIRTDAAVEAFQFVERSKSRTLMDLLERNLDTMWGSNGSGSKRAEIEKVRRDLNALYSRLSQAGTTVSSLRSDQATQQEIIRREQELMSLLRDAGSEKEDWARLETMGMPGIEEIQAMLGADEILIEYYTVGDRFCAFVIGRDEFQLVADLATKEAVRACLKGLNFQLSKFHLSADYLKHHERTLLHTTRHHLRELHRLLLEPLQEWIEGRSLVVIPHDVLHYVPFQALYDGSGYVVDIHDIVYSASASVMKICREKESPDATEDLILAVADETTPAILDEAETLKQLLPNVRVFVGKEATVDLLREYGPSARRIHIAAHGVFRRDNPMFSSIRLGDSWLSLIDIFNLRLGADLTTLSACETGMSALYGGDELLGLARGFLYAGTPSLLVSLWRVNDRSTTVLMRRFYEGLEEGLSKPKALQQAAQAVKESFPHPYYWAPFILMGKS